MGEETKQNKYNEAQFAEMRDLVVEDGLRHERIRQGRLIERSGKTTRGYDFLEWESNLSWGIHMHEKAVLRTRE